VDLSFTNFITVDLSFTDFITTVCSSLQVDGLFADYELSPFHIP
jgi:hypothetical protein